jgi:membrane protease YdiL (CAAX protease family)
MARVKKTKEHKFFNKHTILGVFLLMYFNFALIEFVIGSVSAIISEHAGIDRTTGLGAGSIIGSILALIIWFRFFSPEYKWKPESSSWGKSFKLLIPLYIFWVMLFGAFGVFAKGIPFGAISISTLLTAVMAGTAEEVAFREIGISYLARQWKDENKIILMAVIPAVAFGLTHVTNFVMDKDLSTALTQALMTFFMGVFYAAVYLRTGNIWPLILCHSLHDIMTFSVGTSAAALGLEYPDWITMYIGVLEVLLFVCGLYMLRRSKRAEIIALWNHRWSRDTVVNEEI